MEHGFGVIEVDLFSEDVESPEHPEAVRFRALLEEVAGEYSCSLVSFSVHRGTVTFSFDSERLTADIVKVFHHDDHDQS